MRIAPSSSALGRRTLRDAALVLAIALALVASLAAIVRPFAEGRGRPSAAAMATAPAAPSKDAMPLNRLTTDRSLAAPVARDRTRHAVALPTAVASD